MMRLLILPFAAWMGLLSLAAPSPVASDFPQLFATAGVLGSLTVLVYRLGIWRQEMENTRSNVGAEVRSHREESTQNFARIETKLDHMITDHNDFKRQAARWQHRTVRRLKRVEEKTQ
jgi:hypothetical protein